MSEATKHIQHTPGPLHAYRNDWDGTWSVDSYTDAVCDLWRLCEETHERHPFDEERSEGTARLLAAAYSSYDEHCGARAIEAAEADLLGKALEALRMLRDAGAVPSLSSLPNTDTEIGRAAKAAHNVLALVDGGAA